MQENSRRSLFKAGVRDGIPIGLGYFAVSFSLGIAARNAGLSPFQGALSSFLIVASAGEYALFTAIAEKASFLAMLLITLVANARYLLMSCALSQRLSPDTPMIHRICLGAYITDELFGITIAQPDKLHPIYTYGAVVFSVPCWTIGTALGIMMGNILPLRVVSALSVALYGMFIAIIIPPAKKSRVIAVIIAVCFALSALFAYISPLSGLSASTRTIILTVLISSVAAVLFPVKEAEGNE